AGRLQSGGGFIGLFSVTGAGLRLEAGPQQDKQQCDHPSKPTLHTHTHTHTRAFMHMQAHTHTHTHTHTSTDTCAHRVSYTRTHTYRLTQGYVNIIFHISLLLGYRTGLLPWPSACCGWRQGITYTTGLQYPLRCVCVCVCVC